MSKPIVSISLGCPAVFLLGGETRDTRPTAVLLRSAGWGEGGKRRASIPFSVSSLPHALTRTLWLFYGRKLCARKTHSKPIRLITWKPTAHLFKAHESNTLNLQPAQTRRSVVGATLVRRATPWYSRGSRGGGITAYPASSPRRRGFASGPWVDRSAVVHPGSSAHG